MKAEMAVGRVSSKPLFALNSLLTGKNTRKIMNFSFKNDQLIQLSCLLHGCYDDKAEVGNETEQGIKSRYQGTIFREQGINYVEQGIDVDGAKLICSHETISKTSCGGEIEICRTDVLQSSRRLR
jgi:hypothetical protein